MRDFATTPSIDITIGRQTRWYHAFVTNAPAALDSPSTVTLYTSTLNDIAGLAAPGSAHTIVRENGTGHARARLVLVGANELAWHRARCRGHHFVLHRPTRCSSASPPSSTGCGNASSCP